MKAGATPVAAHRRRSAEQSHAAKAQRFQWSARV